MTPKEKATELLKSMYGNIFDGGQYEDSEDSWYMSKQCAIIAVDEIINETVYNYDTLHSFDRREYWMEVKKEIEKL